MAARAVIHAAGKNGGINMRTESDGRSGIASGLTQWTSDERRHAGARTHNAQTDRETNTSLFAMTSYRKRAMRKVDLETQVAMYSGKLEAALSQFTVLNGADAEKHWDEDEVEIEANNELESRCVTCKNVHTEAEFVDKFEAGDQEKSVQDALEWFDRQTRVCLKPETRRILWRMLQTCWRW